MVWPVKSKQNSELHGIKRIRAGKLHLGADHLCLSEQSGRRIGDIRSLSRTFGGTMEVEMKIRGLMMDPVTNMPIVILKDSGTDTVLPIWVGVYEANAIALEIEKVTTPRPMTHDLIKNVL